MEETQNPTDFEVIELFSTQRERAWALLLEKYSSRIYGLFRHWGLEHGEAAVCFSALSEHLASEEFRRLQSVSDLASKGSLFPWLRALARKFALDWVDTPRGYDRVQETIQDLTDSQRRLFELYFIQGLAPPEIRTELQAGSEEPVLVIEVLERLDELLQTLSREGLWRLFSQLARSRREDQHRRARAAPEKSRTEANSVPESNQELERLWQAWASLDSRTALILQLRFDDCQSLPQIALITGSTEEQAQGSIRSGLLRLRRSTTGSSSS